MTVDPAVVPGLLLLAVELLALAGAGYVIARVVLRQRDQLMALAQGLLIGPALWGLLVNFLLHALPGRAGAVAGWACLVVIMIGILLCKDLSELKIRLPLFARFFVAALTVFGFVLAARQTMIVSDAYIRFGLAAPIQAQNWPPIFPWSPWQPAPYHYGADLLVALLDPPFGPNLALTTEVLEAYAWSAMALLVGAMIRRMGGWTSVIVFVPLLLSAGVWTQLDALSPSILQMPILTGIPEAGIRTSLIEFYAPELAWPWDWPEPHGSPPNIWFPRFTIAYGLAVVVLERVSSKRRSLSWFGNLTLAALVGFAGLVDEAVALVVLGLWVLIEADRVVRARLTSTEFRESVWPTISGLVVGLVLLAVGGGVLTGVLAGTAGGELGVGWLPDAGRLRPLTTLNERLGGAALIGIGPGVMAVAAAFLRPNNRLVLSLAIGCGAFVGATVLLESSLATPDDTRLDGHAGNFALLALLVAAAQCMRRLHPRRRMLVGTLAVALMVWPTIALPVRTLGFQLSHGIALSNATLSRTGQPAKLYGIGVGRQSITPVTPDQIADYEPFPLPPLHARQFGALKLDPLIEFIIDHTRADARIFSPHPTELTLATGRPNASGFPGFVHLVERRGPEYEDVLWSLEPAAVRRLGLDYIHATDAWVAQLPKHAQGSLEDPKLFELLIRHGAHALYRVLPAYWNLDTMPSPKSFESIRQAVPESATVILAGRHDPLTKIKLASLLGHTRLIADLDVTTVASLVHPLIPMKAARPGSLIPNVLILPRGVAVYDKTTELLPVWWNDEFAVYAPDGLIRPLMDPPPRLKPNFGVHITAVDFDGDRIAFTAHFANHAPDRWKGQDWLISAVDASSWAFPYEFETDGRHKGQQWYGGQITPEQSKATHAYEFDPRAGDLVVRNKTGRRTEVASSGPGLGPGLWTLALRLRGEWHEAAFIPVMKIVVAEGGDVTFEVYEGELNARLAQ